MTNHAVRMSPSARPLLRPLSLALAAVLLSSCFGGAGEDPVAERRPTPTARPGGDSPIPPSLAEALRRAEEVPTPSEPAAEPRPVLSEPWPDPNAGAKAQRADDQALRAAADAAMRALIEHAELRHVTALRRQCYIHRSDVIRLNENEAMVEVVLECRREVEAGGYLYETVEERGKLAKEGGRWVFKG